MRLTLFIFLLVLGMGCTSTKNAAMKPNKFNGTWVPVKQELGGTLLPNAAFDKQQLIITDNNYTVVAERVDKGIVRYSGDKMDIYGKDGPNAGKHFTAIYKYEKEQLTICYNLVGDTYPDKFETRGKPMYFLSVFKKK